MATVGYPDVLWEYVEKVDEKKLLCKAPLDAGGVCGMNLRFISSSLHNVEQHIASRHPTVFARVAAIKKARRAVADEAKKMRQVNEEKAKALKMKRKAEIRERIARSMDARKRPAGTGKIPAGLANRLAMKNSMAHSNMTAARAARANYKFAAMLAANPYLSHTFGTDEYLVGFTRSLNASWTPPTASAAVRLQDRLEARIKQAISTSAAAAQRISLVVNASTSTDEAQILNITAHWFDQTNCGPEHAFLSVSRFHDDFTPDALLSALTTTLVNFNVSTTAVIRVVCGLEDPGQQLADAWRQHPGFEGRVLPCYSAVLKRAMTESELASTSTELNSALAAAHSLVARIAESATASQRVTLPKTHDAVERFWPDTYTLCVDLLRQRSIIASLASEIDLGRCDEATWTLLDELARLLGPLAKYAGVARRRAPVLLSEVVATYEVLRTHWRVDESDWSPPAAAACAGLERAVSAALAFAVAPGSHDFDAAPAAAALLDPRVSAMLSEDLVNAGRKWIMDRKWTAVVTQNGVHSGPVEPVENGQQASAAMDTSEANGAAGGGAAADGEGDPDHIMDQLLEKYRVPKHEAPVADEMETYEAADVRLRTSDDVFSWWGSEGRATWPTLSDLALDLLAVPAAADDKESCADLSALGCVLDDELRLQRAVLVRNNTHWLERCAPQVPVVR